MSMIEVRTADLIGLALDWAVAKTEQASIVITFWCGEYDLEIPGSEDEYGIADSYSPSTDWSQGGPLIDKCKVALTPDKLHQGALVCQAFCAGYPFPAYGATALIAACRAIVAAKLGDVVSVPAELVSK